MVIFHGKMLVHQRVKTFVFDVFLVCSHWYFCRWGCWENEFLDIAAPSVRISRLKGKSFWRCRWAGQNENASAPSMNHFLWLVPQPFDIMFFFLIWYNDMMTLLWWIPLIHIHTTNLNFQAIIHVNKQLPSIIPVSIWIRSNYTK